MSGFISLAKPVWQTATKCQERCLYQKLFFTKVAHRGMKSQIYVRGDSETENSFSDQLAKFTQTDFYRRVLQGVVYTLNLAFIDAGYSGDWSRIGAISTETEFFLRQLSWGLLGIHVLSALATAFLNINRKKPWLLPSLLTLGIGVLNLLQQIYEDEQSPTPKITPLLILAAILSASIIGQAITNSYVG